MTYQIFCQVLNYFSYSSDILRKPQKFDPSSNFFLTLFSRASWRCAYFIWPSQNIRTLKMITEEVETNMLTHSNFKLEHEFWSAKSNVWFFGNFDYRTVASRSTSWLVTPHVTNWIWIQSVTCPKISKNCSNELKFWEVSRSL